MRKMFLLAATAILVAGAPALAQGHGNGGGKGNGGGNGGSRGNDGGGPGNGGGRGGPPGERGGPPQDRGNGHGRGNDSGQQARADRGPPQRADQGPGRGAERRADRGPNRGPDSGPGRGNEMRAAAPDRGPGRADGFRGRGPDRAPAEAVVVRDVARGADRDRAGQRVDRIRYAVGGRYYAGAPAIIDGCPPGLARKNNGCLPPGQARKIWGNPAPYDNWYGDWSTWRNDSRYDYRYADGYLYRVDTGSNLISAFLPLLGGALFGGNSWPQSYNNYDVSQYYDDYYGYDDGLDYRYADGAILGVNPGTNAISGIAALLTGNDWNVGQAMPAGYDFYNVPPQYRDRYVDGADAMYRYSDGYVYQVDPTSQLVEKAIQLLG